MKDIMKYYLQLITLVFCLLVSACSDDDETTTPVFPDLQKIECEVGDTKTLTFEAADNWILTSSSLWCYFEQDGERTFVCSGNAGKQTVTIHISDDATELLKSYKAELTMKLAGSQQVIAEVTRPSTGYEVRAFNADKSVMYTEENPFVINFDGTDILVLEANEDWALKSNPEWMEFNRRASDSEVVSGNAGDNVSVIPQMIMQYKKNEITGFLTIESRSGAVAKVPVKYEGIPADRIIGTLKDNIEVSVDGESYTAGDNSYDSEGVPVTVMAKNDEYTLVCVEYVAERNQMTWELEYSYTIMDSFNRWLWIDDDKEGNINIAAGANNSKARTAYVLAFPNVIYAEIKDHLSDLVLLEKGIPKEYDENIIADIKQEGVAGDLISLVKESGEPILDGTGNPVKAVPSDMPDEQLESEYGTTNVFLVSSLTLGVNYDPFHIIVNGYSGWNLQAETKHNGQDTVWEGIEVEGRYMTSAFVNVSGMDESKNGTKPMVIKLMDNETILGVLLIQPRYED
ncbi:DUF5003 domain-containing protein [Bacteroides xylanisolvens]|uniref:DUF5003 domain-containing protein n=1 Tax=Bacteroides xylanisolvens TaxID=371601 RepID=UPI00125F740D|nr:DUF5003 domain-containing protein [Bacteroides xylanisolvens]KAB6304091.1 DUF5003 domain-containing protein [Bacteroides xylanisolvens]